VKKEDKKVEESKRNEWFDGLSQILERNKTVASAAIVRAVEDASEGLCVIIIIIIIITCHLYSAAKCKNRHAALIFEVQYI